METEPAIQEMSMFLAEPASYPHRPDSVSIQETHVSIMALASPLVYKVKKPFDFSFLSYATLDRRRRFCAREVELTRISHQVFVDVLRGGEYERKFRQSGIRSDELYI